MSANLITKVVANIFSKGGIKALKFKSNEITLRLIKNSQSNSKNAKYVRNFVNSLDNEEQLQFAKNIRKKTEDSESLREYVDKIESKLNSITTKMFNTKGNKDILLTTDEKQFVDDFGKFFVKSSTPIRAINSTYILTASYDWTLKELSLTMIRGKSNYRFYNVPREVWLHLSTLPSNAGTYWWDQWFKYTIAPFHSINSQLRKYLPPKIRKPNFKSKRKN